MAKMEYRAVFGHGPHGSLTYGDAKETLDAAMNDSDPRAAENLATVVGVQRRPVEPWETMGLRQLLKEVNDAQRADAGPVRP